MAGKLFGCACFHQKTVEVRVLDYRHRGLSEVPAEVFAQVYSLEELRLDNNNVASLHKELFCCHELRKLSASDNDLKEIPPAIGELVNLLELDIARNSELCFENPSTGNTLRLMIICPLIIMDIIV